MDWQSRKVLVTGAGGFIGSHLTETLVRLGADVRAFVRYNSRNQAGYIDTFPQEIRKNIEIYSGDLKDPDAVRSAVKGRDIVFHLGALIAIPYSYVNPMDYVQTNVAGTANVLNACLKDNVDRLIHTSTSEVYGNMHYAPMDEKHPISGKSPYAASKISADRMALSYKHAFDMNVSVVRPFNTFGPRQSMRAVIPTIITQVLKNDEIRLGALYPTRDFNFIANTVSAFLAMASSEKAIGEVINFGSGREVSIQELCDIIMNIMDRHIPISQEAVRMRPSGSEVNRLNCDCQKAKTLLGWEPAVSLEEGLAKTIEWSREQIFADHQTSKYVI